MDYYGLLFLYYLKGLSGKSILRLFFNIEVGGTEQLLPENTSTPTTTPILADIQYPDELRTDQYFTYRETPTTVSNKARIKTIKGNTLVWNQLVQNGNFADSSLWAGQSTTISISNNIADVTLSAKGTYVALRQSVFASVTGHKYLVTATFKSAKKTAVGFYLNGQSVYLDGYDVQANTLTKVSALINGGESGGFNIYVSRKNELEIGDVVEVSNVMLIDLTEMGLDSITNPAEFTSLFPHPYYAYNAGTLLSFNGTGLKTVGFNQWDEQWEVGAYNSANGSKVSVSDRIRNKNPIRIFPSVTYYRTKGMQVYYYDASMNYIGWISLANVDVFTPPSNAYYMSFNCLANSGTTYNNDICINISNPARNGIYEPYTTQTTSLPISTYFPTGMKSAGTVYDELTPTKAVTRIGAVDLGTQNWRAYTDVTTRKIYYATISGMDTTSAQLTCDGLTAVTWGSLPNMAEKTIQAHPSLDAVYVCDSSCEDATKFTSAMSGVYLYYELATPTETPITTEDANEALSLLMGKSVSSSNAKQMIDIIMKGE